MLGHTAKFFDLVSVIAVRRTTRATNVRNDAELPPLRFFGRQSVPPSVHNLHDRRQSRNLNWYGIAVPSFAPDVVNVQQPALTVLAQTTYQQWNTSPLKRIINGALSSLSSPTVLGPSPRQFFTLTTAVKNNSMKAFIFFICISSISKLHQYCFAPSYHIHLLPTTTHHVSKLSPCSQSSLYCYSLFSLLRDSARLFNATTVQFVAFVVSFLWVSDS